MFTLIATGVLLLIGWGVSSKISSWRQYHKLAKSTGFPTFISPIHISDAWWMILYPILLPGLEKLPASWTNGWLSISKIWKLWKMGHLPFDEAGSDTFMLSTLKGNILWTCDHSVIHDLLTQHPKVQMPVDLLHFYDVWGPTVGSVEGEEWKVHRKVISSGFSQSVNYTVWREAQRQTQTMIECLKNKENSTMTVMRDWTSRLALHVISSGFFNMKLNWDSREDTRQDKDALPKTLPFDQAIMLLLRRLSTVFVTPRPLLHKLPFAMFREASLALNETERYISKQRDEAAADVALMTKKRNLSILEAIVISGTDPEITNRSPFLEKSVLGNMFFMLMAGHETVGSTLAYVFMFAALYPEIQDKIHAQLENQLGERPADQWLLEQDYPILQKGYIGAVQREVLSIYQPASFLLRRIVEPVTLIDSNGISHHVPAKTLAFPNTSAAYKNPRFWHHADVSDERRSALSNSPALYFNPDRWLDEKGFVKETTITVNETREVPDWWGFGQGARACPGKAFAQIEMTSAMATLFKGYSLELVVSDKTLAGCNGDRKTAWEKTRDNGIRMLCDDIEANITISLPTELPIKVVRRIRTNEAAAVWRA